MVEIKVWREHNDAKLPIKAIEGSACYDLYSIEEVTIPAGEWRYIENGVRMIVPDNYYIRFNTRSSLGFIKDLFVYPGVLDSSWSGNLKVKVYNLGKEPYTINKGDRYAQFELLELQKSEIKEVNENEFKDIANNCVRGNNGGWGSSGK